jgi:hypothetical protein
MNRPLWASIVILMPSLVLLSPYARLAAQTSALHKQTVPRAVTLNTILSCSDDALIEEIFETDATTAHVDLNAFGMVTMKRDRSRAPGSTARYMALLGKGFITLERDETTLTIMPTDYSGKRIQASQLSFCHGNLTASYEKHIDDKSGPRLLEIDGEGWSLNPSEVFARADQFRFESGVFNNSSDVFLTAIKGRVSIQFVCKPNGVRFYRAIYALKDQ